MTILVLLFNEEHNQGRMISTERKQHLTLVMKFQGDFVSCISIRLLKD